MAELGRNEPCHCGSGKKYKKCCLAKDTDEARIAHAAAEAEREADTIEQDAEENVSAVADPKPAMPRRQVFAGKASFGEGGDRGGRPGGATGRSRSSGHR